MSNIQAALYLAQFERLKELISKKEKYFLGIIIVERFKKSSSIKNTILQNLFIG